MISTLMLALLAQAGAKPSADWQDFPAKGSEPAKAGAKSKGTPPPAAAPLVTATPPPVPVAPAVPPEALARYRAALQQINRGEHAAATQALNTLAREYPRWASVFAARCTAQVGLNYPQNAVEDCEYALKLDSSVASALWWLAEAEAALGHRDVAARTFRQYAASPASDVLAANRERAQQRAAELDGPAPRPTTPAPPPPPPAVVAAPPSWSFGPGRQPNRAAEQPRRRELEDDVPCHSSLDCGPGGWCKERGDGVHVCMGGSRGGSHGDSCSSTLDCGSGKWCKDRGDGMMVCMGGGGQGASCSSTLDCSSGLWCRESDGINRCLH